MTNDELQPEDNPKSQIPNPKSVDQLSKNQRQKIEQRIKEIEKKIPELENHLANLTLQMGMPEIASEAVRLTEVSNEYQQTEKRIHILYEEWENLLEGLNP